MTALAKNPKVKAPPPTGRERRHVKTPTILQMEAVECGAAALAIVLAYHGRWVPLEQVRQDCGVSRDGSKASKLVKAAKRHGLNAKGRTMPPGSFAKLPLPAILFWNFNHFVVLEGYGPGGVYLNDPARGPRSVSWDEFDGSFTGVVLELVPTDEFNSEGSPPSLLKGMSRRLRGGGSAFSLCLLAGLGLLVPGLIAPAATRIFVDEVLVGGVDSWRTLLIVGLLLAAVVQLALTWLQQVTLLRLSVKLSMSMSTRFMEHLLRLPLTFFGQRAPGAVVSRLQTNDQIASLLSSQLSASLLSVFTSVFYLALMFVYSWQLTLVAISFSALNVIVLRYAISAQKNPSSRLEGESGKLTGTTVSGLANIETLKASSEDGSFFARWAGQQVKVLDALQEVGRPSAILSTLPAMLIALNTAALLGFGGLQVMDGNLSIGTLTAFQVLAGGFTAPIVQLVGFGAVLQQATGSLARVDDVLNYERDPESNPRPRLTELTVSPADGASPYRRRLPSKLSGAVTIEDLSFGYSPLDPPLVTGFNLTLEPGQRIALVGRTGSGKSTVSRLVAGLAQPWSGRILFDGIPRELIPREILAASLSLVDQDILLFQDSIRDNLTLWDPTIPEDAIVRATRDARIYGDIIKRPPGLERAILEGGRDWSGGQRQRLEIARALATNPSILIMDEATSALDPIVEQEIDQRVRARGCTCLIVAHRLSTIRDADEIIVLDEGSVVGRGTHDQLIAAGGIYSELVGE